VLIPAIEAVAQRAFAALCASAIFATADLPTAPSYQGPLVATHPSDGARRGVS
jgi:hypothetical protein